MKLSTVLLGIALGDEVCYKHKECEVGCFTNLPPWGGTDARPGNKLPNLPSEVNVQFYLDTPLQTGLNIDYGDFDSLDASTFDPENPVYFIIHGYFDTGDEGWLQRISNLILEQENANILRVDWHKGSRTLQYAQAATDTQVVGGSVGCLIQDMESLFSSYPNMISKITCIGHSLGAQACGYVAQNIRNRYGINLPVIHGLDPAEPYFKDTPEEVCLGHSDADFVSIIHSDATQFLDGGVQGLGLSYPVGHIDFWPNGGTDHPGCDGGLFDQISDNGGIWEGLRDFAVCYHQRAIRFFEESIPKNCNFKSYKCKRWTDFYEGYCLESWDEDILPEMGWNSLQYKDRLPQPALNEVYLNTGDKKPFCVHEYLQRLYFNSNTDRNLELNLEIEYLHTSGDPLFLKINDAPLTPYEGFQMRTPLTLKEELGSINSLWVKFSFAGGLINFTHYASIERIYFKHGELQEEYIFCPPTNSMKVGETYVFTKC